MISDVTIIIPAFNHEQFVADTILSCAAQEGEPRSHLLVIDDGSTDDTYAKVINAVELCRDAFSSIRIERQKNVGLSRSLNKALSIVQTKFALIISSDDVLEKQAVCRLRREFLEDSNLCLVVGDSAYIDENGREATCEADCVNFRSFLEYHTSRKKDFNWTQAGTYASFLTGNYLPVGWMIDVAKIKDVGGYDESNMVEDWGLLFRISKKYAIRVLREPLSKYRIHSTNTVKIRRLVILKDIFRIYQNEYKFAFECGLGKQWAEGFADIKNALINENNFRAFFIENIAHVATEQGFSDVFLFMIDDANWATSLNQLQEEKLDLHNKLIISLKQLESLNNEINSLVQQRNSLRHLFKAIFQVSTAGIRKKLQSFKS